VTKFDETLTRLIADPAVIAVILTGSAARGMATVHSDHDVIVVVREYDDAHPRTTYHSPEIDEIVYDLEDLADSTDPAYQWARWQFRGAQILLDRTDNEIAPLIEKQAVPTPEARDAAREALDGYINQIYRAAKNRRDGRLIQAQLDTMESVAWCLKAIFALHGRLRPYNKYLLWELKNHPLGAPWDADTIPDRIAQDPAELFDDIETLARTRGHGDVIDGWDESEIELIRAAARAARARM
jgi:predicted nucleotidyltransferase